MPWMSLMHSQTVGAFSSTFFYFVDFFVFLNFNLHVFFSLKFLYLAGYQVPNITLPNLNKQTNEKLQTPPLTKF